MRINSRLDIGKNYIHVLEFANLFNYNLNWTTVPVFSDSTEASTITCAL